MDVLTEDVRDGSLKELLYADVFFVWRIIKLGYGQVWEMEKCGGKKASEGEYR